VIQLAAAVIIDQQAGSEHERIRESARNGVECDECPSTGSDRDRACRGPQCVLRHQLIARLRNFETARLNSGVERLSPFERFGGED
jgi:hypothetical protein